MSASSQMNRKVGMFIHKRAYVGELGYSTSTVSMRFNASAMAIRRRLLDEIAKVSLDRIERFDATEKYGIGFRLRLGTPSTEPGRNHCVKRSRWREEC